MEKLFEGEYKLMEVLWDSGEVESDRSLFVTYAGEPLRACRRYEAKVRVWDNHGNSAEDAKKDLEGLQMMRTLGKNMAFLIKSIALGKKEYGLPEKEEPIRTNFIN